MIDLMDISRRLAAGIGLAVLAAAPAFAATYQVGLYQGATSTGVGSGSFTFTNPGTVGSTPTPVSLSTNASNVIGAQTFITGNLNVQVAAVNFTDGKTPPNQITGNYVEGLTGSLETAPVTGLGTTGSTAQCIINLCFYRINFFFAANPNPNAALVKTYSIQLIRQSNGNVVATPEHLGRYSVLNSATIPEPGTMALVVLALAALGWRQVTLRRNRSRFRV